MLELVPVVAIETVPVDVSALENDSATLSVRVSPPDPRDTEPRLVMALEAASSVTLPFCVLNDSVVAVSAAEDDCEIGEFVPVVARDMVLALSAVSISSEPPLLSVIPPVASIASAT